MITELTSILAEADHLIEHFSKCHDGLIEVKQDLVDINQKLENRQQLEIEKQ